MHWSQWRATSYAKTWNLEKPQIFFSFSLNMELHVQPWSEVLVQSSWCLHWPWKYGEIS